ncbi:Rv3235 family protein [Microbacterium sp. NPDC090007]|uniref:Rv3235 family protein n=1 Tax=Microbacterium sp. NPDC090007 TaxID=3364204 RepID=UPI0037FE4439
MSDSTTRIPPTRERVAAARTTPANSDFFGRQRTPVSELPPPEPFAVQVVHAVLEVLAGVREVDQLARWLSGDVYSAVTARASLTARARSARGLPALRTTHAIRNVRASSPADHVVEATVTVATRVRTRAVALRLEGLDGRWRVTSLGVL